MYEGSCACAYSDACPAEQVAGTQASTPKEDPLLGKKLHPAQDLVYQALLQGSRGLSNVTEKGCLSLQTAAPISWCRARA